jgi:hypothetical protein
VSDEDKIKIKKLITRVFLYIRCHDVLHVGECYDHVGKFMLHIGFFVLFFVLLWNVCFNLLIFLMFF